MTAEELLQRYTNGERDFSNVSIVGEELIGVDLREINFRQADLNVNFEQSDLRDAVFESASVAECLFMDANLSRADFSNAVLSESNFEKANLGYGPDYCKIRP